MIAFFGGLSGIVASSTKSKGNVIPGVAIATALMPPLCTAGFGLATGNLYYFFGAFYLFFINTVFISLATFLVVRILKYSKKEFIDKQREKIVTRYVGIIVFCTIVPSLYLSYNLVRTSYFNEKVRSFVSQELNFPNTQILSRHSVLKDDKSEIKVVLIGQEVPKIMIENARTKLKNFGLHDTQLTIQQGFGKKATDINELKSLLMQDLYKNSEAVLRTQSEEIDSLKAELNSYKSSTLLTQQLVPELKVLFPFITEASCSKTYVMDVTSRQMENVLLVYFQTDQELSDEEQLKMKDWLKARGSLLGDQINKVKLLIENKQVLL